MKTCCTLAALMAVTLGMSFSSMADIPYVYDVENTGTNYSITNFPTIGQLPVVQPLPDPFMWFSSYTNATFNSRSTNFVDWEHHRNEIGALIQHYEIGTKPTVDPSQVSASYTSNSPTSGTLTVNVTVGTNTLTLTCPVTLPSSGSGPFPICIGMDSPYGSLPSSMFTSRNIAGITFYESQVSTYGNPQSTDPFFKLYGPVQNVSNTGQYAAWSWGISRVIDGLYKLNGQLGAAQISLNHIAVTGCSYAGKMALFAGAFDERIALTIAQESGGGGANSWRYNHAAEPAGSVEDIDNTDYNWFANQLQQFAGANVSLLPDDHHELDAMVAPRALYVTGNTSYTWLGNPSCYVCSRAAQQIYAALGIPDRFGFNIDGNHQHCMFPSDQTNDLAYFLDKFMLGETNLSSVIATYPSAYDSIGYARWYAWWGTDNPIFPSLQLSIPATATEGDGVLTGSVTVIPVPTSDVTLSLTSSDTSEATVPASVVIPAGQSNTEFNLTIMDDTYLDGDQTATITAANPNYTNQATITIHDKQTATLSVTLPASASEAAGTLTNAGTVSVGTAVGKNVTVSLASSDPARLIVPSTTVIPAGQTSGVFSITLVDDHIVENPHTATVTAHVPNWTDGSASMTILDADLPDHFGWGTIPSPQFVGQPFNVTVTAYDTNNNQVPYNSSAELSAWVLGAASATNEILGSPAADGSANFGIEVTVGYSFTPNTQMAVTAVRTYFGDKVSIWNSSGMLLASQNVTSTPGTWVQTSLATPVVLSAGNTYVVGVHVTSADVVYWDNNLAATFPNGTINESLYAAGDGFPNQSDSPEYLVGLQYGTNVALVPLSPVESGNFTAGVWSGNVTVLQPASGVTLRAGVPGHFGQSLPFDVINAPQVGMTASGSSVVVSWPESPSGFILEQTHDLAAGPWTTVTNTPAVINNNYVLTNTPSAATTFYRLRMPR